MAHRFLLAYYYASPEDVQRIAAFRVVSGDAEKTLITQYVRGWLGLNRDYYLSLGRLDAKARGMEFRVWGRQVLLHGMEGLPDYVEEIRKIPPNPLRDIVLPPSSIRKPLNYIMLGTQNLVLLRVGIHYDRDNAIGFVSRIVKEHLDRNWEKLYASQVAAENFENWS